MNILTVHFFNFHQVAEDFDQYDKLVVTRSFTFQPFYNSFYSAVNYNTCRFILKKEILEKCRTVKINYMPKCIHYNK